jgi:hypothetical protein
MVTQPSHHHLRPEEDEEASGHRKLQNGYTFSRRERVTAKLEDAGSVVRLGILPTRRWSTATSIPAKEPMVFESLLTSTLTSTGI